MSKHRIVIQIKPFRASEEVAGQIIAFKEGNNYCLVGWEQTEAELKALLPEIGEASYHSIVMTLEIRAGNEVEASMFADFLTKIKSAE